MSDDEFNKPPMDDITKPSELSEPTKNPKSEQIYVKKSTYKMLIVGITASLVVIAFFSGYTIGSQTVAPVVIQENPKPSSPQPTQVPTQESQRVFISTSDDPVIGNPNAPVTMVEFSDFQCPFCERFFTQTLPQIKQNYIDSGKVKLVFRDFPIESIHPNAKEAAIAAECANEQKMFWQYHDKLFESQTEWARLSADEASNSFKGYASELGLATNEFDTCLDSAKYLNEIGQDFQNGASYGVTGTPAFFIGNDKDGYVTLIGAKPYASFQQVIDSELS